MNFNSVTLVMQMHKKKFGIFKLNFQKNTGRYFPQAINFLLWLNVGMMSQ